MAEDTPKSVWITAIERLGAPVVFLVVILIALWKITTYVSTEVITPLMTNHLKYVDTSTKTLQQMQENGRDALVRIEKGVDEIQSQETRLEIKKQNDEIIKQNIEILELLRKQKGAE